MKINLRSIISVLLAVMLVFCFTGCKNKEYTSGVDNEGTSSGAESKTYINNLTGEIIADKEVSLQRPVAIMVNNISIAQPVQTGLNDADIIYETEVEGGITRLMAVFKDLKSVKQVGTVRSARYPYIDLAAGHNAVFVHHGIDNEHATPHLGVVKSIVLGTNNGGKRVSNGLASEHTLYAYGDKLWETIKSTHDTSFEDASNWANFADGKTPVKYDNASNSVTIPFSTSYKTVFNYDANTGRYTRYFRDTKRQDYVTGEAVTVKNVFVLNTTISDYDGCKEVAKGKSAHRKVELTSGSGYYFVNGTYTKINWSKGDSTDSFKFTKEDGSALTVDVGNSWVCLVDKNNNVTIAPAADAAASN